MKKNSFVLIIVIFLSGCFVFRDTSTIKRNSKYKIVSSSSDLSLEDGKGIIKGYVFNAFQPKEYLDGVIVAVTDSEKKLINASYSHDSKGSFEFLLPSGDYTLEFTYLGQGFETKVIKLKSQSVIELIVYFGGTSQICISKKKY